MGTTEGARAESKRSSGRSTEDKKMSFVVFSNIPSMNVQRQLGKTTSKLETSFQRLSSGLRINSAKDDAAGLAITERMEAQIRGMEQARRNSADAVSLAQTVESGLGEVSGILQRLRELSVQAANDTNTASDRQTLDAEASQLIASLDQIATSTEFNGQKVLDGTVTDMTFQIGANNQADQRLTVQLGGIRASQLGQMARESSSNGAGVQGSAISGGAIGTADAVVINGNAVSASSTYGADIGHDATVLAGPVGVANEQNTSAYAKAKAINASATGVKATAEEAAVSSTGFTGGVAGYTLQVNGVTIFDGASATTIEEMANQINVHAEESGVTATINGGNIDMKAADGRNINIRSVRTGAAVTDQGFTTATTRAAVTLSSNSNITINDGSDILGFAAAGTDSITVDTNNLNTSVDLGTRTGALESMDRLDAALDRINLLRGRMGATQNRLESTSSNLAAITENLSAAKSRIKDADFARESAMMTRNQILQQAASAMLVQANQAPQAALQLLQ
jgi:flagellin